MSNRFAYDWSRFTLRISIDAPPRAVYEAWTDQNIITEWFTEEASIKPRGGGRLHFRWLGGDKLEAKVVKVAKDRLFVFQFGTSGEEVEVRIGKAGRSSIVQLQQYNMKTTPKARVQWHMGCREGWTFFLTNLKAFLEYGIDLRTRDPKRCYRQGYVNS